MYALKSQLYQSHIHEPRYIKDLIPAGFVLGSLATAKKFLNISMALQFVSMWGAQTGTNKGIGGCGTYEIVKVEQEGWRDVGVVS